MRMRASLAGAVVLLALSGRASAQIKDPAELFPAHTLAYAELRHPAQISREIAALTKGSYLDDLPARMVKFHEKLGDERNFFFGSYLIGMLGSIASPEMVAEFARLQGGAVALTGFNKEHEPEIIGIVLAGESNAPTFFFRMFLTMDDSIRSVGEVEGVALYRQRRRDFRGQAPQAPNQPPPPAVITESGPTFALLPGAFVIGSTKESVKEVIQRVKGKTSESALTSKSSFNEAAALRDRPGVFAYADVGTLADQLDTLFKDERSSDAQLWSRIKTLVNPQALRSAAGSFMPRDGSLELHVQVNLDPKQSSPLLDLLPDKKVNAEVLHAVPKDAMLSLAVSIPDGEKRLEKVVTLLDNFARGEGAPEGQLPHRIIADMEARARLKIGKDVLAKISAVALVFHTRGEIPQGGTRFPMPVVTGMDEAAAKALEESVPKLIGLFGGDPGQLPTTERVQGQPVRALPGDGLPWRSALHYGRQGNTLVFGQNREVVGATLAGAGKKEGLLGDARVAAAIKGYEEPVLLGAWSLGPTLGELVTGMERSAIMAKPKGGGPPNVPPEGAAGPAPEIKSVQELVKALEPLPPAVIAVVRKKDTMTLDVRLVTLKSFSAKVINILFDALLEQAARTGPGGFGIGGVEAPPMPVQELK